MNSQDLHNLQEAYLDVYDNIMEKEDSPYERASDAALDARYGYGRASGDKRSFGRAANRASAAAMLRRLRRDRDEGRTTSRESGADAVHQGWAHTARTSSDQTPEKKERRAKLADTPYSQLPNDEQEKDRVSADAVRALYNRRNQREDYDLYDIILTHLIDEGYADTFESAEVIMVNMSEEWRESICEGYVPLRTSDEHYDDEGFPTTTRSWSKKLTNARIGVGKVKDRSRKNSGDPIGNLIKGVSAKKRLDAMKRVDDEPESVRAKRSQAKAAANRQLGTNRRSLQTSLDREHLTKSLKSS